MRSEYIAMIIFGVCFLISTILFIRYSKESDRRIHEVIKKRDEAWAKAVDSVTFYRDKTYELYEFQLAEKEKRIEDLERQIAMNESVMSLVNVIEPLRGKIDGTAEKSEKN